MKKSDRDKVIQGVTDELLTSKFISELGQKARVERWSTTPEQLHYLGQLREVLSDIGRDIAAVDIVPKGMEYVGSLSVHLYKAPAMNSLMFVPLTDLNDMTYDVADAGLRELTGSVRAAYGMNRQKLRSQF